MKQKNSKTDRREGRLRAFTREPIFAAALIVLIFVLLLSSGVTAFFTLTLGNIRRLDPEKERGKDLIDYRDVPEPSLANPVPYDKEITNILLLGIDSRDPDSVRERSDATIILTVNRRQRKLKLTSLQRDMLVYIPGKERPDKLTHANVYGGPELTMRVVNETLRLSIDRYVIINIRQMELLIDAVGGVMIDVTPTTFPHVNRIIEAMNLEFAYTDPVATLTAPGRQLLNGRQAVAYARDRSTAAGDYDRMSYQQEVLQALFDRFREVSMGERMQLMTTGLGMMTTNLSNNEIMGLIQSVMPMLDAEIERLTLPIEGYNRHYSGLAWVNLCDFNGMIPLVQEFIFGETFPFDPVPEIPGAPNSSKDLSELTGEHNDVTLPPDYVEPPISPIEPYVPEEPVSEAPTAPPATSPRTERTDAPPATDPPVTEPSVTESEIIVIEPTTPLPTEPPETQPPETQPPAPSATETPPTETP